MKFNNLQELFIMTTNQYRYFRIILFYQNNLSGKCGQDG